MKIVVLDGYAENPGDLSWESVKQYGELELYDRTPYEDAAIIERIGMAEIVLTNKTPISRAVISSCPKLRFISVLATGYNVIDYSYARERGIPVSNVPLYGTASVAQAAIALLLEVCNHVAHHSEAVHGGRWSEGADWCFWDYPLIELAGKTIGIIGFGHIGQTTGAIAKALGMRVIAYNRSVSDSGKLIGDYVSLDTLLSESDVIALHCPLSPETNGIICADNLRKMKDGVIIINNSRGQLIVEEDLAAALNCEKVAAAGLDVLSSEPPKSDNPLLSANNCFITPHISWASKESRQRIMNCTENNIAAFIAGSPVNVINS